MAINFPIDPEIGQIYEYGTKKWKWNGLNWAITVEATILSNGDGTKFLSDDGTYQFINVDVPLPEWGNISGTLSNQTDLQIILNSKASTAHNHDDLYYTETEVNNLLLSKSSTAHNHDDRYYTETEVNTLLLSKSSTAHTHTDLHTHTNKSLLDSVTASGDGTRYLANDGTYKLVESGTTDHGLLSGLGDDDHTQYLNSDRHSLIDHSAVSGIPTTENIQDISASLFTSGTHSGITFEYDDANNKINVSVSGGTQQVVGVLDDLTDVTISNPVSGQSLVYNGSTWINELLESSGSSGTNVSYLTDIQDIPDPIANTYLKRNNDNTSYVWETAGTETLETLTDVLLTDPVSGDAIIFDGTTWKNQQLGTAATKNITYSTEAPSGVGSEGDIWIKYTL